MKIDIVYEIIQNFEKFKQHKIFNYLKRDNVQNNTK